eukprot:scaffold1278_cov356-Prasinococcus_capsulatus_cf.AAC.1
MRQAVASRAHVAGARAAGPLCRGSRGGQELASAPLGFCVRCWGSAPPCAPPARDAMAVSQQPPPRSLEGWLQPEPLFWEFLLQPQKLPEYLARLRGEHTGHVTSAAASQSKTPASALPAEETQSNADGLPLVPAVELVKMFLTHARTKSGRARTSGPVGNSVGGLLTLSGKRQTSQSSREAMLLGFAEQVARAVPLDCDTINTHLSEEHQKALLQQLSQSREQCTTEASCDTRVVQEAETDPTETEINLNILRLRRGVTRFVASHARQATAGLTVASFFEKNVNDPAVASLKLDSANSLEFLREVLQQRSLEPSTRLRIRLEVAEYLMSTGQVRPALNILLPALGYDAATCTWDEGAKETDHLMRHLEINSTHGASTRVAASSEGGLPWKLMAERLASFLTSCSLGCLVILLASGDSAGREAALQSKAELQNSRETLLCCSKALKFASRLWYASFPRLKTGHECVLRLEGPRLGLVNGMEPLDSDFPLGDVERHCVSQLLGTASSLDKMLANSATQAGNLGEQTMRSALMAYLESFSNFIAIDRRFPSLQAARLRALPSDEEGRLETGSRSVAVGYLIHRVEAGEAPEAFLAILRPHAIDVDGLHDGMDAVANGAYFTCLLRVIGQRFIDLQDLASSSVSTARVIALRRLCLRRFVQFLMSHFPTHLQAVLGYDIEADCDDVVASICQYANTRAKDVESGRRDDKAELFVPSVRTKPMDSHIVESTASEALGSSELVAWLHSELGLESAGDLLNEQAEGLMLSPRTNSNVGTNGKDADGGAPADRKPVQDDEELRKDSLSHQGYLTLKGSVSGCLCEIAHTLISFNGLSKVAGTAFRTTLLVDPGNIDAKYGLWLAKAQSCLQSEEFRGAAAASQSGAAGKLKRKRSSLDDESALLKRDPSHSSMQDIRDFADVENPPHVSIDTSPTMTCPSISELLHTNPTDGHPCPSLGVLQRVFDALCTFSAFNEAIAVGESVLTACLALEGSDVPGEAPVEDLDDDRAGLDKLVPLLCGLYIELARFILLCKRITRGSDQSNAGSGSPSKQVCSALAEGTMLLLKQFDEFEKACLERNRSLHRFPSMSRVSCDAPAGASSLSLEQVVHGLPSRQVAQYLSTALVGLLIKNGENEEKGELRRSIWKDSEHGKLDSGATLATLRLTFFEYCLCGLTRRSH